MNFSAHRTQLVRTAGLWLLAVLCSGVGVGAQTLSFFDVDASAWPHMKGKFYAFDQRGAQQRPLAAELKILEDGTSRTITKLTCPPATETRKISAALVVDISGSMGRLRAGVRNLDIAKTAAMAFVEALPTDSSECAITSFDNVNYLNQDFTTDKAKLNTAINSLKAASGTDYNAALINPAAGGLVVTAQGRYQRVIVMLTDGIAQTPMANNIVATAKQQNCIIYVVTLGMACPQNLRDVAAQTGGAFFEEVTTADDAKRIYQTILQVSQGSEPCSIEWESVVSCQSQQTKVSLLWKAEVGLANFTPPTGSGPGVTVIPTSVKFGAIKPATIKDTIITIKAVQSDFVITRIYVKSGSAAFSVVGQTYPINLAADSSRRITIRYSPTDSSTNYAVFEIESGSCPSFFSVLGGFPGKSNPSKTLRVESPNGGEEYVVGSDTLITWSGVAPTDRVGIEYSVDAGLTWKMISDSAFGLRYNWNKVPLPASTSCLVRVQQWAENGPVDASPTVQWQRALGGFNYDEIRSVRQTLDGGYVLAGHSRSYDGDVGNNRGERDCWVVKLTQSGAVEWKNTYGGTATDEANCIQQTLDGGYLFVGTTSSSNGDVTAAYGLQDAWVAKLSSVGNLVWERSFGGTDNDVALDFQQTSDGGYVVAGHTASADGDIATNKGMTDVWVAKLDQSGNPIWHRTYGGSGNDVAQSVKQTRDGGYVLAGSTDSPNGDVTLSKGGKDFWIIKLNGLGKVVWEKCLGGTGNEQAYSVRETADDGYIVAGYTASDNGDVTGAKGNQDVWLVKLNSVGDIEWQKTLGGPDVDFAYAVVQVSDGGYVVTGSTNSRTGNVTVNKGISDFWVVKVNALGTLEWQRSLGGQEADVANSIQQTVDEGFIVAGYSGSSDGDVTSNHGGGDGWVVRLGPEGKPFQQDTSDAVFTIVRPEFTATDVDMGSVSVGSIQDSTLAPFIRNVGTAMFRVDSVYFTGVDAGAFGLLAGIPPYNIPVGNSNVSEFTFAPTRLGPHTAQIVIITQCDTLVQTIRGNGVLPTIQIVNTLIDFGVVALGGRRDTLDAVTIKNTSGSAVVVTRVFHDGPNVTDFTTLAGGSSYTLAPNEAIKLDLRFTPGGVGRTSGQLVFAYKGVGSPARVQLFGTGVRPVLGVVDTLIDFGKHRVGSVRDTVKAATIKNVSSAPVDVLSVSILGGGLPEFTIQNLPITPIKLLPDSTLLLDLRFSPTKIGLETSELLFEFDGVGSPARVLLRGEGTGELIEVANSLIDFGEHLVGTSKDTLFAQTLRNVGNVPIVVSQIGLAGPNADMFTVLNGSGAPSTIQPGASVTIDVRFSPTAKGVARAELKYEFQTNAIPALVQLIGSGSTVPIVVLDTVIDFGIRSVGTQTDSLQIETIQNVGTLPIQITSVVISGPNAADFTVLNSTDNPFPLAPGNAGLIDLRYSPSASGPSVATLTYTHNGLGGQAKVTLLGSGIEGDIATLDTLIDFGERVIGTNADTLGVRTIKNVGGASVNITNVRVAGIDAADFLILTQPPSPFSLNPNDEVVLDIRYMPVRPGASYANIVVDYNGAGSPAVVNLTGTGKPVSVTPGVQISVGKHKEFVGREVVIPVNFTSTTPRQPIAETRVSFQLAFNPTLLYPLDLPFTMVDSRTALVVVNNVSVGTLPSSHTQGLRFITGLGNATASALSIRNTTTTQPLTISTVGGEFQTLGICYDGGARLINPTGQPNITGIAPNPASGNAIVNVEFIEAGFTELFITDLMGRRIETLYSGTPTTLGSTVFNLNAHALSAGSYVLTLRTPTSVSSREVRVAK